MGAALVARYWCYMCSQMVNPNMEADIKCPYCDSGFVEEMDGRGDLGASDLGSNRALSLWAPILLGIMAAPRGAGGSEEKRKMERLIQSMTLCSFYGDDGGALVSFSCCRLFRMESGQRSIIHRQKETERGTGITIE